MKVFKYLILSCTLSSIFNGAFAQIPPGPQEYNPDNEQDFLNGPPRGRRPFGPGPRGRDGRRRPPLMQSKPASIQPSEHILSALTPNQKLSTFSHNVRVFISGQTLSVESNGIPNHPTGNYPNEHNPNSILEQDYHFHIPLKPQIAERTTALPFGPIGVAVNGIPFYNPYNAEGRDAVFGPNAEVFDSCCGHPDPNGRYHYHKYPVCINSPFRDPTGKHSPLIGWSFDGFAIYGPNNENGQAPTDLDECNGHIDSTRGYHYHVTNKFPYVLGAYRGVVEMSNFDGPVWGR